MPLYLNDQGQWVDDEYGPAPGAAPANQWTGSASDWAAYNNPVQARSPVDTQDFLRSFGYTQGAAQGTGELNRFLQGLVAKGFTGDDFVNGLEKYNQSQGLSYNRPKDGEYPADSFYTYNGNEHVPWWGEQKRIEAIGRGLDALGKPTGWESQYNDALAQAQQSDVGRIGTQNQNNLPSDMDTLMDVLKFAGAAGGLYGLGGFLGGAGAAGGALGEGSLASTLAAEGSSGLLGAGVGEAAGGVGQFVGGGELLGGAGGGSAAATGSGIGNLGSGTFGLDLGGIGGTATGAGASTELGALGIGSTGTGLTATGGGALGSGLGGLSAADLGSVGLGALSGGGAAAVGGATGTAASTAANAASKASSLSRILDGSATTEDWLKVGGTAAGGILDYMSSSGAADNAKAIADRTWNAGQQYRDNASRAMTPGFDLNSIPGYSGALSTGMDAFNRSLSAKNGNPWGQGGAAGEAISWAGKTIGLPAWQNYFNSNSNAGGLSNLATQSTTAGLNAGAADQATYGSLGQTARNIFDPKPDYQKQYLDLLGKQYGLA